MELSTYAINLGYIQSFTNRNYKVTLWKDDHYYVRVTHRETRHITCECFDNILLAQRFFNKLKKGLSK